LFKSVVELERLAEERRHDRELIESIFSELRHRNTDRANQLREKIRAILDGLELPFEQHPPDGPVADTAVEPAAEPEEPDAPPRAAARPEVTENKMDMAADRSTDGGNSSKQRPMPDMDAQNADTTNPLVLTRMLDLIDYVIAVEKDKLKLVTDFAEHRALHYSHEELDGLPGITFNRSMGEDVAFLSVERLNRRPPPEPTDPALKPWLLVADDPGRQPMLRLRLSAAECKAASIEDDTDAGLDFEEFAEAEAVRSALARYVAGPWTSWVTGEVPRRKTMAVYASLFALRQSLATPDGPPQELVCGLGYAALARGGKRLRYPLLTIPLDIELDQVSHVIALVPRAEGRIGIEADQPDALGLSQVDSWRRHAKSVIDGLEDDPLSPFVRTTYDPILQNAAALFDPKATYAAGSGNSRMPVPSAGPDLQITDAFGFLQRERRATQLMADLLAFRDRLLQGGGKVAIPAAIAALFTDPSHDVVEEEFPTFRGINSIPGATSSDGSGTDLFFPKPFNAEQVQIAQRLAVRSGVVVQGPPGTGKTHTIANIISHYLATGRRVLVTSQKSPALKVLQQQLPPEIQPLAVSLLDSDREGLRQFRGSVDLISERLQHLRKAELDAEIQGLQARIDGLHRQLAANDRETEKIGRTALSAVEIDGLKIEPIETAHEVLAAGGDATWLPDVITPAAEHVPVFGDQAIADLRTARAAVGSDLSLMAKTLPPASLLADQDAILDAHERLQKAAEIEKTIEGGAVWRLVDTRPETVETARTIKQELLAWNQKRLAVATAKDDLNPVLADLLARSDNPVIAALELLREQAAALKEDQSYFLTRPVELPDGWLDDPKFKTAVADLANGGPGLAGLAGMFARRTKTLIASVRLQARPPSSGDQWHVVARFIDAGERAVSFVKTWNHARSSTSMPAIAHVEVSAGREALELLDRLATLRTLHSQAEELTAALRRLLPKWPGSLNWVSNPEDIIECLNTHTELADLQAARSVRKSLVEALRGSDTDVAQQLLNVANSLGETSTPRKSLENQLTAASARLQRLHSLKLHFATIDRVCGIVAASGAPQWAHQLRTVPAGANDPLCPGDWRRRWRLRRLDSWLETSNQSVRLRSLQSERERAEADLSKAYVRLIEQRTWRALKANASPSVMQALAAYAIAVGKIGRGTGKSANRYRNAARKAADAVKGALPCWIMPHSRVSESLPPEFGIFDLVIVDEASQSTLASLPALFRAKQILVVGDDKQVSPDNVGLNMEQANTLVARHLGSQVPLFVEPMRQESSLYDLASVIFGADRFMLREHFRCAAPIIEFSKRQFYRNELRPLRVSKASERLEPALCDVLVTDGYRKGRGKTNPPEADFIIEELRKMEFDPSFEGRSIGVTTLLGTEQAALIYGKIEQKLGIPFIEKFKVRVGDPATFQGDERDIMFLSMVATPDNASALSGLAYEQRFNVAASRARERMILIRSVELEQLSPNDKLRRALLEHFRSPFPNDTQAAIDARSRCESDFEREMFDALHYMGYALDTQVRVGNHRIDIVVEGELDRRLAVECDGDRYHGPDRWPDDMQRQRTLERAGWRFWRCFASRFVRERDIALRELCDLLDAMDIKPRSAEFRSTIYTSFRAWNSSDQVGPDPEHDGS
jgi:very-short-patch-repair endonuclease